jgi:probable phosphoglycerate mutase
MSSLQCPTRVFVARHGEAEYETDAVTDDGGSLTPLGRAQARGLAERLRRERISRVWTSPLSRAVQTAEIAAGPLGVSVVVREGLREYTVGSLSGTYADERAILGGIFEAWMDGDREARIPGGDRVDSFVHRVATVFEEVADQHRGEAVLVVSHGGAILAGVPHLLGLPAAFVRDRTLTNGGVLELAADADGWRLVRWADDPL